MADSPVRPIPAGYHTVTPYLIFKGAAKAIDFCKQAFGAAEVLRMMARTATSATRNCGSARR
jgi:PhnB protein